MFYCDSFCVHEEVEAELSLTLSRVLVPPPPPSSSLFRSMYRMRRTIAAAAANDEGSVCTVLCGGVLVKCSWLSHSSTPPPRC